MYDSARVSSITDFQYVTKINKNQTKRQRKNPKAKMKKKNQTSLTQRIKFRENIELRHDLLFSRLVFLVFGNFCGHQRRGFLENAVAERRREPIAAARLFV